MTMSASAAAQAQVIDISVKATQNSGTNQLKGGSTNGVSAGVQGPQSALPDASAARNPALRGRLGADPARAAGENCHITGDTGAMSCPG